MKRVLRRLGYSTSADVIEIKGRIACELSSADELLLTEMIFNGLFNPMNPPQVRVVFKHFGKKIWVASFKGRFYPEDFKKGLLKNIFQKLCYILKKTLEYSWKTIKYFMKDVGNILDNIWISYEKYWNFLAKKIKKVWLSYHKCPWWKKTCFK